MEKEEKKQIMEVIELDSLTEGSNVFESKGKSILKVTKNNIVKKLEIPIKSSGVSEIIDKMKSKSPKPPTIYKVVYPDDVAYKELGLTRKQHIKTVDLTDDKYLKEKEEYETDLGLKIVLQGIDLPIKNRSGELVEDEDLKIDILKNMGLSGEQFSQLVFDISSLTDWKEEKENDFLEL